MICTPNLLHSLLNAHNPPPKPLTDGTKLGPTSPQRLLENLMPLGRIHLRLPKRPDIPIHRCALRTLGVLIIHLV